MSGWSDTFDRADGPMGSDWSVMRGTCTIDDNRAVMVPTATMQAVQMSYAGDLDIGFTLDPTYCIGSRAQIVVHTNTSYGANMSLQVQSFAERYEVALVEYDGGFGTFTRAIGNQAYSATTPVYFSVRLVGTHWSILANGVELDNYDGAGSSSGSAVLLQMVDVAAAILSFNVPQEAAAMAVTPDPVWVGGGSVQMVATGTLTSWTAGVPGSSTITVDHGTIEDQWTEDATTIHFTLVPAQYVGTLTFTESQYALTDEVTATLTPQEGQSECACLLTPNGAAIVNRTGEDFLTGHLLTDATPLPPDNTGDTGVPLFDFLLAWEKMQHGPGAPVASESGILNDIVRYLVDSVEITPGENVFTFAKLAEADANAIHVNWDSFFGEDPGTLAALKAYLAGTPGGSHQDILDALAAGVVDLTPVLDAIAGVKGDPLATIKAVLDQLFLLGGGGSNYTLNDVMGLLDYITSDGVVNLNSVLSTLATMRGDNSSTLHAIQAYCVTAIAKLDEIKTYLQDQLGPMTVTLAAIESKVDAILALLRQVAVTRFQPPVWPGLENVDLYAMYSLPGNINLPGPMHGVRITITSTDPGTGFYDYDTHRCWRNIGALAFVTEDGYAEMWQPLGFTNAIYVPKTMTIAGSVIAHLGRGPQGFIQPWTFK